jgi:hypothetical protein
MLCERCGQDISDSAVICPSCGAITSRSAMQPPTSYGEYSAGDSGYTPPQPQAGARYEQEYNRGYQQGYGPGNYMPPPQAGPQQPNYGYAPPYGNQPPAYGGVNVTVYNNVNLSNKNTAALIVEVIASLFGIYGIGWLMAGETNIGILLLIGSFVLYWPIFILGTIFTFGLGLLCLGPLGIAAIIVNAILLNNALNRKAAQITVVVPPPQAQQMRMPPQYPR